jgi:membrane protein DedA with SNARE-associated domain
VQQLQLAMATMRHAVYTTAGLMHASLVTHAVCTVLDKLAVVAVLVLLMSALHRHMVAVPHQLHLARARVVAVSVVSTRVATCRHVPAQCCAVTALKWQRTIR